MLQFRTILPHTLELLTKMQKLKCTQHTRLVGGTALALQYGHRQSVDLDFFGLLPEDAEEMQYELSGCGQLFVVKNTPTIRIFQIDGVKVDFVNYQQYPWIDNPVIEEGLVLASPKDIAAMKINAVEGRGSRKDFIDVYALLQHYSLSEILGFYAQKYPENSFFRALMSLTYFEDADSQMEPLMFDMPDWEVMKNTITHAVASIT